VEGRVKVPSARVSSGISQCTHYTHYTSSLNIRLSYRRIWSSGKLVFSVSCSLRAGLVPFTNKISYYYN
ncbi:BgTH12-03070, partial [Blumeria graminis f. sp. triticale]